MKLGASFPTTGFGRELLAIFARDVEGAADPLKIWRNAGGAHGAVQSMGEGRGSDIDAHIDDVAEVKRRIDAG